MNKQQGLTMIEILVALLVLAVGLLGMASLQVRSVQDTGNSNLRSMAIYLANDMADRIRANQTAREAGNYDSLAGAALTASCLTTANCSSTAMANHDKREWMNNLNAALPGTDDTHGAIARNGDMFTITVSWDERVKQAAATIATGSISLTFEP